MLFLPARSKQIPYAFLYAWYVAYKELYIVSNYQCSGRFTTVRADLLQSLQIDYRLDAMQIFLRGCCSSRSSAV
jgi:hypothetical protein